ncbi:Membrane protein involved in aromatic hydrocarbon degradation [Photobacterium marinum]|uniref:Membrane protein involved in aromatic hydrocarbon degradation n=1 Tax=Photobacterium marinum TaxID=1056511 RepID=L8JA17_9GAMM|nr:outer membrane protein transport protein [Photobacterium marinum]ELR64389.1 Membrane protein involved in aromatic hydrocarbon degradation [Photobacterium marinum]
MRTLFLSMLLLLCVEVNAAAPAFSRLYAVADSAETVYHTPAGMTRLDANAFTLSGILIKYMGEFDIDESVTTISGGAPDSGDPILVPSLYYVHVVNDDWRAGISLNIPTGFGSSSGGSWAGRYYSTESSLILISTSPGVAYRVNEWLSLGGGLNINYTTSDITTAIANSDPDFSDGKLEVESDGLSVAVVLSSLIELSPTTRIGLNYHTESEADSEPDVKISGLGASSEAIERLEVAISDLEIASKIPAHFQFGIYHRLDNDWELTFDSIWMNFSEFGVTEISIVDNEIQAPDDLYEDFWALSAGLSFPLSAGMTGRVGALYAQSAIKDENRSFSFALDRIYGLGAGIQYEWQSGDIVDVNLNIFDTGNAPIDTGDDPVRGRIAGEYVDHYALGLELSYHWN